MSEGKICDQTLKEAFSLFSEETKRLEKAYRLLQREFKQLNDKLECIVTHFTDGLIFVTAGGEISLFNPTAETLTQYKHEQVIGKSYWECFPDGFFGFSLRELMQNPRSLRCILSLDKGQELEVSTSPVPGRGITLFLRDITEIKRLKQTVEKNDRLKELGEMAAGLAHEIRNPLGGITGFASLLVRDLKEAPLQQMAQSILEGTQALNRLVTNVLDYARPFVTHLTPTDCVELVRETLSLIEADASVDHPFHFECELSSLSLLLDKGLLKAALLNLFLNAAQASPKKGSVHISLSKEGVITVTDQGEGIAPEDLPKIFTPFFTTKAEGTGLGLAEAHKIVAAHGGILEVDSQQHQGTTVTLKLPVAHDH